MRVRIIAAILALSFAGIASATPIKFTYTGTGSGALAGTAFSDAAFTITSLGDTDDRQSFSGGFSIDHISATIDISGVGTFAFITATRTFINNSIGVLGLSRASPGIGDLYDGPYNGALLGTSWDMLSDLGPVAGPFNLIQWSTYAVDTSGGVLALADLLGPGTFTATLMTDVPEPTTLWLMLAGMCGIALMMRRPIKSA